MLSLNQVQLIGNVCLLKPQDNLMRVNVATNASYIKDGEKVITTEYHNCTAFGKTAEIMQQYLTVGQKVFIQGKLKTSKWQDKQTWEDKYKVNIVVESFLMLGGKRNDTKTWDFLEEASKELDNDFMEDNSWQ